MKTLEYQGSNDIRIRRDGSTISPASSGDPDDAIGVWTMQGYAVSKDEINRAPWVEKFLVPSQRHAYMLVRG